MPAIATFAARCTAKRSIAEPGTAKRGTGKRALPAHQDRCGRDDRHVQRTSRHGGAAYREPPSQSGMRDKNQGAALSTRTTATAKLLSSELPTGQSQDRRSCDVSIAVGLAIYPRPSMDTTTLPGDCAERNDRGRVQQPCAAVEWASTHGKRPASGGTSSPVGPCAETPFPLNLRLACGKGGQRNRYGRQRQ